jgi:hypothetical protein
MSERRREFPDRIKVQILKRAMDGNGRVRCEGCGGVLKAKDYEFDHTIPEALIVDKSRELTADDGKLLGKCCHRGEDGKTAKDVGVIAKAKRQERGHLRLRRSSNPFPGSKASGWKKPFNRPAERRT